MQLIRAYGHAQTVLPAARKRHCQLLPLAPHGFRLGKRLQQALKPVAP